MRTYAAAILGAATQAKMMSQLDIDFMHYIAKFNKKYESIEEYEDRIVNFAKTDKFIKEANSRTDRSYRAGHNKFSDWTDEEYKAKVGLKIDKCPILKPLPRRSRLRSTPPLSQIVSLIGELRAR